MKKQLYLLLITVFCCFSLAACAEEENGSGEMKTYEYDNSGDVTVENDSLAFTVKGDSSQFEVKDKKTGKIYTSNPSAEDIEKYGEADGQFKDILSATLALTYSNETNTEKQIDNYGSCIQNKNYQVEKVSDSEIVVHYSVGDFEKTYVCPIAIKESRMKQYLDKMDSSTQSSIRRYYNYYNYEEMKEDDAEELAAAEALFPDLKDEPVYYLKDDITDTRLKSCEKYFVEAGYTADDRIADMGTYKVSRNEGKPIFDIDVHYVLEEGELVVKVPMKDISYNTDYPIVKLQVLPYMGASNKDEQGYVLVPEGTGGLIRFNNGKTDQQTYQGNMYGWDYGINRTMVVDESKASMPAFVVANETSSSSFICTAEEGSSYATVVADIAGKNNGYNYGSFTYQMVHGENMDVSSKSDTTVRVYEDGLPDETITQRYIFSDQTGYVELAASYRDYLMKKYPDQLKKKETSTVPLAVEMIGAVDDTEHILGYPVVRSQSLTSYEQAKTILQTLKEAGISNLTAKYTGWFNTGVKQTSAKKVSLVGRLGSKSDLKELTSYAEGTDGLDFYLNGVFTYVYKDKWFDGFGVNSNAAKFCSREICELYTLDPITYQSNEDYWDYHTYDSYYLTKPAYAMEALDHYAEETAALGAKNIGLEDIGNQLAGDYNPKDRVSREKALNMQVEKMSQLKQAGTKLMITGGNQYAVPYADYVTDLNIANKSVNIVDESVPFYQLALHGLVDYSGSAVNLSADQEQNVLKAAETGAGLYYTYIYEKSSELQDGKYTKYYACNFDEWKEDTVALYKKFEETLGDTYNQFITGHEQVAKGVYKTTYESGKSVLVNYNYEDYNYEGTVVPQRDFVIGGEK